MEPIQDTESIYTCWEIVIDCSHREQAKCRKKICTVGIIMRESLQRIVAHLFCTCQSFGSYETDSAVVVDKSS